MIAINYEMIETIQFDDMIEIKQFSFRSTLFHRFPVSKKFGQPLRMKPKPNGALTVSCHEETGLRRAESVGPKGNEEMAHNCIQPEEVLKGCGHEKSHLGDREECSSRISDRRWGWDLGGLPAGRSPGASAHEYRHCFGAKWGKSGVGSGALECRKGNEEREGVWRRPHSTGGMVARRRVSGGRGRSGWMMVTLAVTLAASFFMYASGSEAAKENTRQSSRNRLPSAPLKIPSQIRRKPLAYEPPQSAEIAVDSAGRCKRDAVVNQVDPALWLYAAAEGGIPMHGLTTDALVTEGYADGDRFILEWKGAWLVLRLLCPLLPVSNRFM